jgi:V/A-type H+-transporting ATPase subunit I
VLRTPLGLVTGLYKVYDTAIGHISDVLSYTRLAALGMASVLVGQVMNFVAGLMIESVQIAVLGIVLAALVFVVGHAFNLAISLLGAFVHTLRLQFVEFFSKFYSGGGKAFAPFDYGTRSLVLRREAAQEEGG